MRRVKRPPARLRLPGNGIKATTGEIPKWSSTADLNRFRQNLHDWLLTRQKYRCTYCWLPVGDRVRVSTHLDHFVPKNKRNGEPSWTFEILNLILSCDFCNVKLKKNFNPLVTKNNSYKRSVFNIFHPYLDRASDHFSGGYYGASQEPSVPSGTSPQGTKTINLFDLASHFIQQQWHEQHEKDKARQAQEKLSPSNHERYMKILDEIRA